MKIKNQSLLKSATGFIALTLCAGVNATLIYTAQGEFLVGGESLIPSSYRSSMDENKISFEFDSDYLLSNFIIPFNTIEAAEMLSVTLKDSSGNILSNLDSNNFYGCNASNGYLNCGSRNPISNLFGEIKISDGFKDTHQFNGMNLTAEDFFKVLSTNYNDIELFPSVDGPGITYNVSRRIAQQDPVNASAPGTLGLLLGAGALAFRRKFKQRNK